MPRACTRSSTRRVLTPSTYAWATTLTSARSARRRGVSSQAGKYDPVRSLGDPQADGADAGVPAPAAVAVAPVGARGVARAVRGAGETVDLARHERFDDLVQELAQEVRVGVLELRRYSRHEARAAAGRASGVGALGATHVAMSALRSHLRDPKHVAFVRAPHHRGALRG